MLRSSILVQKVSASFPSGNCSGWKASDSMILLRWLLRVLQGGAIIFAGDSPGNRSGRPLAQHPGFEDKAPVLGAMQDGCVALLSFFQTIHRGNLFLQRQEAASAAGACNLFCNAYVFLARHFFDAGRCRFHLEPSLHMFRHVGHGLELLLSRQAPVCLSPAAFLCEQGEDFIGRISRITRRVSARLTGQRTLQRYCIKLHLEWGKLGF